MHMTKKKKKRPIWRRAMMTSSRCDEHEDDGQAPIIVLMRCSLIVLASHPSTATKSLSIKHFSDQKVVLRESVLECCELGESPGTHFTEDWMSSGPDWTQRSEEKYPPSTARDWTQTIHPIAKCLAAWATWLKILFYTIIKFKHIVHMRIVSKVIT